MGTVDLRSSTTMLGRVAYTQSFATSATHVVRIVAAESGRRVTVDAFVVMR
jgi:hypothetical protein